MKKIPKGITNNKGVVLFIALGIGLVIAIILMAVMPLSINKLEVAKRWSNSAEALSAADAGLNDAIWAMNNYDTPTKWTNGGWTMIASNQYRIVERNLNNSAGNTVALYTVDVDLDNPDGDPGTDDAEVDSTGFAPTAADNQRSISVSAERITATPSPGDVDFAVGAEDQILQTGGSATIVGPTEPGTPHDFEEIFGVSKNNMRKAVGSVVDPSNNYTPVSGVTWLKCDTSSEVKITQAGWSGSGVLIVEGDLQMQGGTFDGVIWVEGTLDISGGAIINGAIICEGDVDLLTGNPTITYTPVTIANTVNVTNYPPLPYEINSWREN